MDQYITRTLNLSEAKLSRGYYYNSVVLCIIDAVYSIGARYSSTENTVFRYCRKIKIEPFRKYGSPTSSIINEHTVSDFLDIIKGHSYEALAASLFENKQRTSTNNGILKAQAVCEFAEILQANNINSFADVPRMYNNLRIENQIRGIRGQGTGISLNYFYMLSGNDDLIKADRHILRFIYEATGQEVNKQQAEAMLTSCVDKLRVRFPHLTCRLLDHTIWSYMSTK